MLAGKIVSMFDRNATILAATLAICSTPIAGRGEEAFSFATLKHRAEALALEQHQPPQRASEPFLKLDYDGYRLIAARHENALWRDIQLPFLAEFFSAGFIYEYPVEINTVDTPGKVTRLEAGPQWFQYRGAVEPLSKVPGGGFSGLRLLAQLGANQEKTEFVVFQGASYFRGRGAEQIYGSSARGLAIDTGLPSPEEFPRFTKFWIEQPVADAKTVRVWALMDSPAVAGAYEFVITPGKQLAIDVNAEFWFRHGVQKVGIAPLTSMWMWDAANQPANEHRPEVHDSDGLLIHAGADEWTWRPLSRPKASQVSKWNVEELHGFGLLQRDRDLDHYRDNEAKYHERPSMWVTPAGDWGPGRVELLELPAETEGMDNIGAYWIGVESVKAGSHRALKYRITFGDGPNEKQPAWQIGDTRVRTANDVTNFEIEFKSGDRTSKDKKFTPKVSCDSGTIENIEPATAEDGRVLVRFGYRPAGDGNAHLQAQLGTGTVSEKWSYLWTRN